MKAYFKYTGLTWVNYKVIFVLLLLINFYFLGPDL